MKRILTALLAILLLCSPLPVGGEETPLELNDAAAFRAALAEDPYGSYLLTADLDLGGEDWIPLPFYGTLDGGGHTLYNLRVRSAGEAVRETRDGNLKPYDTVFAGLFSVLEDAEVKNLNLAAASVFLDADAHCFAGLLAGGIFRSAVRSCALEGRVRLMNRAVMTGVGGAVGYGCGSIADCDIQAELVFEDRNFDSRCEEFLGGVLACGIGEITRNRVTLSGWDSCRGYVHNGGLVGMYYHCGMDWPSGPVTGNTLDGQISFFEDNPDRRAYCFAVIGETLSYPSDQSENDTRFVSDERYTYDQVLEPEQCAAPDYEETVTPPDCESWGFTAHRCRVCGYGWTDSYTPPAHSPGDWTAEADMERLRCTVCGALLGERELPPPETETPQAPPAPQQPELPPALTLRYRERALLPLAPPDTEAVWTSTDRNIVTVDQNGAVYGAQPGAAEIVCTAADGAEARCAVAVRYSFWQWIVVVFLFGWLWY